MSKKKALAAATGAMLLLTGTAAAADTYEPLYKYEGNAADGYGYGSTAVHLYPGSIEHVHIPSQMDPAHRELRSGWVATIANLNFPMVGSQAEFEAEFAKVIADFEEWNMNALIFQVSPLLDAYYPSQVNPWSQYLAGAQGQNPGFDPLAIMVEKTHQAAMEYHAWMNPYRVTNEKRTSASILQALNLTAEEVLELSTPEYIGALVAAGVLAEGNYAALYPERVQEFDEKLFLDPGIPQNQDHVAAAVAELVKNYDVDAIHFDDYFYPYQIFVGDQTIRFGDNGEDRESFEAYGIAQGYSDDEAGIRQWRLDSITALIEKVNAAISSHNAQTSSSVQFGVSPFGIWEHNENDPRGSNTPTSSSQTYSRTVFADTLAWVEDELVDYMAPQIYWSFAQAAAPYGELARWWNNAAEGSRTHIYVGHALYKHVNNGGWDSDWMNPQEVPHQLHFNQTLPNVNGSILFSYNDMKPSDISALDAPLQARHEAKNAAIELLKSEYFNAPVLLPEMAWLSHGPVAAPVDVVLNDEAGQITWQDSTQGSRYFAIYTGTGDPEAIINGGGTLIDTIWAEDGTEFSFEIPAGYEGEEGAVWVVTALDAAAVQSAPVVATASQPEVTEPETTEPETTEPEPTDPGSVDPEPSETPAEPETPVPTEGPGDSADPSGSAGASDEPGSSAGGADLPSTGAPVKWGIGTGVLLLAAGALLLRFRKNREQEATRASA